MATATPARHRHPSPPGTPATRRSSATLLWWAAAGIVLGVLAVVIGWAAVSAGTNPPEAGLDVAASHHRFAAATALALAIQVILQPVGAALILALLCLGLWYRRSLGTALAFGSTVCAAWLPAAVDKALVSRARPPAALTHALVSEQAPDSFPSGHTEFAAALALGILLVLVRESRGRWVTAVAGILAVVIVGASRIYLGVHYPSDLLGSVLTAVGGALLWTAIWRILLEPRVDRMLSGLRWARAAGSLTRTRQAGDA